MTKFTGFLCTYPSSHSLRIPFHQITVSCRAVQDGHREVSSRGDRAFVRRSIRRNNRGSGGSELGRSGEVPEVALAEMRTGEKERKGKSHSWIE